MKKINFNKTGSIFYVALILLLGYTSNVNSKTQITEKVDNVVFLEQKWNEGERLSFYDTPQGSQLLPYYWFLALEQASNSDLFRDNKNIKSFGYIPQASRPHNPDGLPIGFVKDQVNETLGGDSALVTALFSSRPEGNQNVWLGLTCAACHTSEINYKNKTLRIDGGSAQSDVQSFIVSLSKALAKTVSDDTKLTRFAKKIIPQGGYSETEKQALKKRVKVYNDWLKKYIDMNYGDSEKTYGYGRLDAFGAILNQITSQLLDIRSNASPANAPVSYPFLWNTSQLDWVQWNGSVSNHIARNVGEVTGVFAHTILKTDNENERFYSSAKIDNLDRLEQYMAKLDSPKWGAPLPEIDQDKAEKGKALYANNCISCHSIRDANGQFPMTKPNAACEQLQKADPNVVCQFIKTHNIPLKKIDTDPLMAMNFIDQEGKLFVDPGQMRPYLAKKYQDVKNYPRVPRGKVLVASGKMVILKQINSLPLDDKEKKEYLFKLGGYHFPSCETSPPPCETSPNVAAYKARPLNGIWATAPYLHNGSVASLYQLLLPDVKEKPSDTIRKPYFYVGSKNFDPKDVGFESNQTGNAFRFDTALKGNSNKGHSGDKFTKTLDKNGQWQDFTNDERYQLIEYMKTL